MYNNLIISILLVTFLYFPVVYANADTSIQLEALHNKNKLKDICNRQSDMEFCNSCIIKTAIPLFEKDYHSYIESLKKETLPKLSNNTLLKNNDIQQGILDQESIFLNTYNQLILKLNTCIDSRSPCSCQEIKKHQKYWSKVKENINTCISAIKQQNLSPICKKLKSANSEEQNSTVLAPAPAKSAEQNPTVLEPAPAIVPEKSAEQNTAVPKQILKKLEAKFIYIPAGNYHEQYEDISDKNKKRYLKLMLNKMGDDPLILKQGFSIQINETTITDFLSIYPDKEYFDFVDASSCNHNWLKVDLKASLLPAVCLIPKEIVNYIDWLKDKNPKKNITLPTIQQWLIAVIFSKEPYMPLDFTILPKVIDTSHSVIANMIANTKEWSSSKDEFNKSYILGGEQLTEDPNEFKIMSMDNLQDISRDHIGFRLVIEE